MVSAPAGNSVPSTIVTCGPYGATVIDSSVVMGASVAAAPEVSLESDDPPHAANYQANADKLRRDKDAEIKNINARATALTNSLRDRQTRPTETNTVSSTASTRPAGCSGKELYREDGAFLVGLAAEADGLKAALDQCYRQYDAARQK